MIDLSVFKKQGNFNPHLLFFDNKGLISSASYFCSENIYNFKGNKILAP
jgi:hypothetical protein